MSLPNTGDEEVTVQACMRNASRILQHAEMETDLAKMERLEKLADSWVNMAAVLSIKDDS